MLSPLDKKLVRDLWHSKGQVVAIAIIVACGVAILVMSLGTLDSLIASREAFYRHNRFADVFGLVKRAPDSLKEKIARIPGVAAVETRIVRDVTLDIEGMEEPALGHLVSLPAGRNSELNEVTLLSGRFPARNRVDEAVVNEAFAEANHYRLGDEVTALINGKRRDLVIVGIGLSPEFIYARAPTMIMPDNRRFGVIWMSRDALAAAFDLDGAFNDVSVTLTHGASVDQVIDDLDGLLSRYGGVGAYARKDQQSHAFLKGEMDQLRIIATIIPPIFILVSAFLLNTVLGRLIDVEREQIGILKAFGYRNRDVAYHYLKFAFVVTAVGLLIGYGLGMVLEHAMTNLYMQFYRFPSLQYRPSATAFLAGALIAIGTASIGALASVGRAARLTPAMAMSEQPPSVYRRGVLDSLTRLFAADGPTRMILRHVLHWPGRSMATVLGVAAATGLMIATLFSFDATNFMIHVIFHRTGVYDASVAFVEPQRMEAVRELARLPGVLAAEPSRDIAVRLRHGPREENAYVIGIDPTTRMKRIVDGNYNDFRIPRSGIVLSSELAGQLGVGRGGTIELEALEGKKPKREVYVSAVNQDLLGAPAYMDRKAINRLMQEGEMVSGAYLQIDRSKEVALYKALKERPIVGSVNLQHVALQMFRDTLAKSNDIMMAIYQALSAAIAAGVVYNSVRIALSERSRELASMRVLGFSRFEVSYILLGQSALLLLVALPLGCVLGYGISALIAYGMRTELYRVPLVIAPASYGKAVLSVVIAGAISALIVRRQIDKLDLIAVLKTRD
jgi:putative ABC transport system permease protein